MNRSSFFFSLLISLFLLPTQGNAQGIENLIEFLTAHPNKRAVARDSTIYPAKLIFAPAISYSPETNLSLGVGLKALFKLRGSGPETRTSNIPVALQYTIENKYLLYSGFEVFTPQERYMITGNVWLQTFPSLYYGIGSRTPASNEEEFTFTQVLLEPIFLKQSYLRYLFIGGGIRYNLITRVEAVEDGLLDRSEQTGSLGSTSVGVEFAVVYDSRDNLLNAKEGLYVEFTHGFYDKVLGGTNRFQLTRLDARYFI